MRCRRTVNGLGLAGCRVEHGRPRHRWVDKSLRVEDLPGQRPVVVRQQRIIATQRQIGLIKARLRHQTQVFQRRQVSAEDEVRLGRFQTVELREVIGCVLVEGDDRRIATGVGEDIRAAEMDALASDKPRVEPTRCLE